MDPIVHFLRSCRKSVDHRGGIVIRDRIKRLFSPPEREMINQHRERYEKQARPTRGAPFFTIDRLHLSAFLHGIKVEQYPPWRRRHMALSTYRLPPFLLVD